MTLKKSILFLTSIGIPLLIIMLYKLVNTGIVQINRPRLEDYPVRGIDVSHHNGLIDWKLVARDGIDFAYIKATEGGDFLDKRFSENWQKSRSANITHGAYHFFTFCRPAIEQLDNFTKTVPIEKNTLPPAIDFEFGGNCKARPPRSKIYHELTIFMGGIEHVYGQKPVLYVTSEAYKEYIEGSFPDAQIWIRDIFKAPKLENQNWVFWQYSARGHIKGIQGITDLNTFSGNENSFQDLLAKASH